MIRYLNHSITEATHIETGEKLYELSHWYISDESPSIAGRRHNGYFKTYQEAEDRHHNMLANGLLLDEKR